MFDFSQASTFVLPYFQKINVFLGSRPEYYCKSNVDSLGGVSFYFSKCAWEKLKYAVIMLGHDGNRCSFILRDKQLNLFEEEIFEIFEFEDYLKKIDSVV